MFNRAKHCFSSQTYPNKELIVLFENDLVTEEYIYNQTYNYYELYEDTPTRPYYILELSNNNPNELISGLSVALKNDKGLILNCDNGICLFKNIISRDSTIVIDESQDETIILKFENRWICFSDKFTLTDNKKEATRFSYIVQLDNSIKLRTCNENQEGSALESIFWKKRTIRETDGCNIGFYKIITDKVMTLGMKRNLSIKVASGDYICVWDDDDWYDSNRLNNQFNYLQFSQKEACTLAYTVLYDHNTDLAYYNTERNTGHENTLLFKRNGAGQYGNLNRGEDTPMLFSFFLKNQLAVMDEPELYIYNYHRKNTCLPGHFNSIIKLSTLLDESFAKRIKNILDDALV